MSTERELLASAKQLIENALLPKLTNKHGRENVQELIDQINEVLRPRQPLDAEIVIDIWNRAGRSSDPVPFPFVRAIEKAHGII